ncbi:MAG TPA: polysaccharide biosynthesis tyrosine autokinase [Gemmatimonadaceae bacterium]
MPSVPIVQNSPVDDDEISVAKFWDVIRRNRWLIAICFTVCVLLGIAYASLSQPVYESSGTIRIDEEQSNLPVLDVLKSLATGNQVSTEMQVLQSRTLSEDVVDTLALQVQVLKPRGVARAILFRDVRAEPDAPEAKYIFRHLQSDSFSVENAATSGRMGVFAVGAPIRLNGIQLRLLPGATAQSVIELRVAPRLDAIEGFEQALKVTRPDREANVVSLKYRGNDPILVGQVPNVLMHQFIVRRQEIQRTEARSTVRFIHEQIDTLSNQLSASEEQLRAYLQREHIVSLPDEAKAQVGRLAELEGQRTGLEAERSALASLLTDVNAAAAKQKPGEPSPYRRLIAFPTLLRNQAAASLLTSLATVEDDRASLLSRRTLKDPDVEVLSTRISDIEDQLRGIAGTYLQGLTDQETVIDQTLSKFNGDLGQVPTKEMEVARLERRPGILGAIDTLLQTRLKEAEIAQAVDDPSVRVVDPSILPERPMTTRLRLAIILGALCGLSLGIGGAFFREQLDRTVHTRDDILSSTGIPVLGLIPRIREIDTPTGAGRLAAAAFKDGASRLDRAAFGARNRVGNGSAAKAPLERHLITSLKPRDPVSEAFRSLRTSITFIRPDHPVKTLVLTSPLPGDGKSTIAANLAISLAQQGLRILLVDADLRRGVLNTAFDVEREPGLSNVLLDTVALESAVRQVDAVENGRLEVLPTGTLPPNPAELLGSARMVALLQRMHERYDIVVLDAPPLNLVTDAALLGACTDGVLLVARAATTTLDALRYSVELLQNARVRPLGVVLNDIDFDRDARYRASYGGYGYSQYYGVEDHSN